MARLMMRWSPVAPGRFCCMISPVAHLPQSRGVRAPTRDARLQGPLLRNARLQLDTHYCISTARPGVPQRRA